MLSNTCTCHGALPQGSPCSLKLANLVAWRLDARIQGFVGKRGITYTRYADDLSFSGLHPLKVVQVIPMVRNIIANEGFRVNVRKTRVAGSARAKVITGLVLSNETFGIGAQKYRSLRAKIHHLVLPAEQSNFEKLDEVQGWLSYLNSVDNKRLDKARKYISHLAVKHPTTLVAKLKLNF